MKKEVFSLPNCTANVDSANLVQTGENDAQEVSTSENSFKKAAAEFVDSLGVDAFIALVQRTPEYKINKRIKEIVRNVINGRNSLNYLQKDLDYYNSKIIENSQKVIFFENCRAEYQKALDNFSTDAEYSEVIINNEVIIHDAKEELEYWVDFMVRKITEKASNYAEYVKEFQAHKKAAVEIIPEILSAQKALAEILKESADIVNEILEKDKLLAKELNEVMDEKLTEKAIDAARAALNTEINDPLQEEINKIHASLFDNNDTIKFDLQKNNDTTPAPARFETRSNINKSTHEFKTEIKTDSANNQYFSLDVFQNIQKKKYYVPKTKKNN